MRASERTSTDYLNDMLDAAQRYAYYSIAMCSANYHFMPLKVFLNPLSAVFVF